MGVDRRDGRMKNNTGRAGRLLRFNEPRVGCHKHQAQRCTMARFLTMARKTVDPRRFLPLPAASPRSAAASLTLTSVETLLASKGA